MAVVLDPVYGLKPTQSLRGGSPSTLAQNSVPFTAGGSITMVDGNLRTVSYAGIYRSQPWVGRACRFTAEQFARLPLHLFRYLDATGNERERDRVHPAAQLLSRPRPRRTGFHLRWDIGLSLAVHGEYVGWLRRRRRGLPPYEIWSLDWRCLIPVGQGDRIYGWRWTGTGVPGLSRGDLILVEDTLHLSYTAPGGGDFGVSPLQQLGVTIRSEDALQRLAEASARNGTRFGAAIILDPKVKSDRVLREGIRQEVDDAHGGLNNAFRSPVLGGGIIDIKPLGEQSAVEAELINQRKVNRDEIAAVSGIPGGILGIYDEVKYSSLKEIHRMLYVTSLGGPLGLVQEGMQAQILNAEPIWDADNRFMEWSYDEVLKGDTKERWETYQLGVNFGGLTLNDVRRKENLPAYKDPRADEPLISANNVRPLSAIGPGGDTGNPQDPNAARATQALDTIRDLVAGHRDRALERAAGADTVGRALDELDERRVARELEHDLQVAGVNGWSTALAQTIAGELEALVAAATTVDDVRALITTGGDQ